MKDTLTVLTLLGVLSVGQSFTKYGRSCKDIGCPSTQECVMQTDPCSYYQRQGECGSYPTCKRKSGGTKRSCSTYVCPPSQVCKMDGDEPKCFSDSSKSGLVGYDTQAASGPLSPSAPQEETGHMYPQIPARGETTPRPNIRPPSNGGAGYTGQIGSGYPGISGYPQYPQQGGGYPQGGYGGGQYPQGGYGGYPAGGNYQGGQQYPGGYQAGYNPYQQQHPQKSSGSSITDKITDSIKSLGTSWLKNYLSKALSGN